MKARQNQTDPFRLFVEVIVSGDIATAIRLLDASPHLTRERTARGAMRHTAKENFFDRIKHYISEGDTALHVAAAAKQTRIAKELIARGADVRAKNRRGAEPLHYAVDGGPGSPVWNPNEQIAIIAELIRAGADPNAFDKSGVAPLHRAVRNRCAAAVRSLIEGGADPKAPNRNGSTPMLLATLNTGKSGSGSPAAKEQQQEILCLLKKNDAR
jgi:hypothetical protein